jgi:integrase
MPKRYQNGKLLIRQDVRRPYYFVKITKPVIDPVTGKQKKKRVEENCGFVDEVSRDEAMRRRAVVLDLANSHRTVAASLMKFRDLTARYQHTRLPQLGVATQNKYRIQIKNHLEPYFGEMRLCEIDRPAVERFLSLKQDLSWWSRVDLKGILSALFTSARDWGFYEGANPTEKIRIGRKRLVREKRLLTAEQFRLILAALDDECRFLVKLLFGLGLRISEALGLQWRDFDLEAGTVTIRRRWHRGHLSADGEMKTENSAGALQLGSMLVEELKVRPRRGPFLFVGEDGKNPPDDRDLLRERFRPVVKRLGLYYPGFGWHAFRRQNITWRQTAGGATPLEAQMAARHGSLDMTLLYTLNDPERERAQVDAMFDKLMEVRLGQKM